MFHSTAVERDGEIGLGLTAIPLKLGTVSPCIEHPRTESIQNLCRGVFELLQCFAQKGFGQLIQ